MPVVLVTHDLDEAAMLADRMCILHRGRTLQAGAPHELMMRPANALVARLVDLKNIFRGKVLGHDAAAGTTALEGLGQRLECPLDERFAAGAEVHVGDSGLARDPAPPRPPLPRRAREPGARRRSPTSCRWART